MKQLHIVVGLMQEHFCLPILNISYVFCDLCSIMSQQTSSPRPHKKR